MRPTPFPEDVPVKTAPYFNTAAWIVASHRNGNPYDNNVSVAVPAPRFNPPVNPIGITKIPVQPDYRTRDDNAFSPLVMGGWNVSGEPVRSLPSKIVRK